MISSAKNTKKLLYIFLFTYFILWGILPSLLLDSIYTNSAQNIAWGHVLSWGYDEHPPLGPWVVTFLNVLLHNNEFSTYIAAAGCLVLSLWITYKIANLYLSAESAAAATALSSLSYYYLANFVLQYNQNVIMLPFWLASVYFFIKIIQKNKRMDWICLSIMAALSILAKYESAIILLLATGYLLTHFHKKYISNFLISLTLFIILLLPHFFWLFQVHFLPIHYALRRTGIHYSTPHIYFQLLNHIQYPLLCLIMQPLNLLLAVAMLFLCIYKQWLQKERKLDNNRLKHLIVYFSIAPLLLTCLISMLMGITILAEWGFPLLSLAFLGIFYYLQLTTPCLKTIVIATLVVQILIFSGFMLCSILLNKIDDNPSYALAKAAESYWKQMGHTPTPIQFIGGTGHRPEYYLAAYLPSKPALLIGNSLYLSPWINKSDFLKSRGMIITNGCYQDINGDFQQKFDIIDYRYISTPPVNKLHGIHRFYTLYIVSPKK